MVVESRQRLSFVRKLRSILIADVVESVRLMEQDEDDTIRRWREFVAAVNHSELPALHGRMVKSLGDGMLLEFACVIDSVRCAARMLERIGRVNTGYPENRHIRLRIGIHLAHVVIDDNDVYGDGVNLAARLASLGGPQEIMVSAAVRDQLADGLEVTLEDLGEHKLKHMQRRVHVYRATPLAASDRRPVRSSALTAVRSASAVKQAFRVAGHYVYRYLAAHGLDIAYARAARRT